MTESTENDEWPFRFEISETGVDWSDLTFKVTFNGLVAPDKKAEIVKMVSEWATKGVEDGYGGKMHLWEIEENAWNKKGTSFSFWADMGSSDLKKAVGLLFDNFADTGLVKKIKVG
ncbi:TPA: hypothetical protein DIU27_03635 [Candidatus Collierbacteria bacterium]|uniref:Uncharacterized protein n=1 Tax=Candidatus Collierbacteria bacterium GW2011_GWB2_44_22 TaxID=1618387 RepID=A0A0G1K7K9_9BACT|nr:MAG: hypothetical protein UW31_C0007G0051 [Candidatus Collierbacteria bacterium GW2011_GWA2_44_13]KKT49430.1 MAG: hypothetical protein UW42_C0035G0014 [Candidatus Collierbacteria bacterium GW2011_GWB1_44_197]KKT52282.1 MAG: hypothetical protein UW44_C0003G0125 [Candidatus Collierbacteria bacterium GW2011_GWB2_44_22]KKT63202.1 MAG: hypothetical protein UW56_C0001G0039 [Candidatus Collierbacteria bacterium GW2011_GWD1_44_27]KKT66112.1 MAG: hypothetical protein UW58_C0013G0040 [Candidatus Colli